MEYKALDGNLWVTTWQGGHGGINVTVDLWNDETECFVTGYNKLVFADSLYECLTGALVITGFRDELADEIVAGWGIELPADEEDDDVV